MNLFINNHWFIPDKKRTGKKISEIRKASDNTTVEKFAMSLNVEDKTVYHWESGLYFPNIENLEQIKMIYNVDFEDLLLPEKTVNSENISSIAEQVNDDLVNTLWFDIKAINNENQRMKSISENKTNELENLKIRNIYIQFWEWWYQVQLFCFSPMANENFFTNFYYLTSGLNVSKFDEFKNKIEIKYGKNYQLTLDDEIKNEILYRFYLFIFEETDNSYFLNKLLINYIYYLFVYDNVDLQKAYADMMPPLFKEIIYNSIFTLKDKRFNDVIEKLKNDGCKKYCFMDDVVHNINQASSEETDKLSMLELQISNYKCYCLSIIKKLSNLSYDEYLKSREDY